MHSRAGFTEKHISEVFELALAPLASLPWHDCDVVDISPAGRGCTLDVGARRPDESPTRGRRGPKAGHSVARRASSASSRLLA